MAYLDVSGLARLVGPPEVIGRQTKSKKREAVGLTASVGIGPNRLIAKLASDADKPAQARVDATLDAIRDRFGRGTIQRGLSRRPRGDAKP